ncbi:MAG: hypothetical protein HYV97_01275 [Bdellovibrio sp.]|nr:hypothetical protein [Bdellovibrio sp.]
MLSMILNLSFRASLFAFFLSTGIGPTTFAHVPSPATDNLFSTPASDGGTSHSGMGRIASDAFEANEAVRETCTRSILSKNLSSICQHLTVLDQPPLLFLVNFFSQTNTTSYLRDYVASVLKSEYLDNVPGEPAPLPDLSCLTSLPPAPHAEIRKSTHFKYNTISATIIDQIYGGYNLSLIGGLDLEYTKAEYVDRLHRAMPHLFWPENRTTQLVSLMKRHLGDHWTPNAHSVGQHEAIKSAYDTLYNAPNSNFKKEVDQAIINIETDYTANIHSQLSNVCNMSPEQLFKNFPGIFDQAIIDMNQTQRAMANIYLCRQSYYYDPHEFDTDCDGIFDDDDPAPDHPFDPNNEFRQQGRRMDDPPFGSDFDYQVKFNKKKNTINLTLDLGFDTDELSQDEKTEFYNTLKTCRASFEGDIEAAFTKASGSLPWLKNAKINLYFNFEEGNDFAVHRCYCADCHVPDPDGIEVIFAGRSEIPNTTCKKDLTPKQKDAVLAAGTHWRDRQDANNVTATTECWILKHEMLHRLGLPDEYVDKKSYPYNEIGPNNSIMNSGEEILPRHVERILRPERCHGRVHDRIRYAWD